MSRRNKTTLRKKSKNRNFSTLCTRKAEMSWENKSFLRL